MKELTRPTTEPSSKSIIDSYEEVFEKTFRISLIVSYFLGYIILLFHFSHARGSFFKRSRTAFNFSKFKDYFKFYLGPFWLVYNLGFNSKLIFKTGENLVLAEIYRRRGVLIMKNYWVRVFTNLTNFFFFNKGLNEEVFSSTLELSFLPKIFSDYFFRGSFFKRPITVINFYICLSLVFLLFWAFPKSFFIRALEMAGLRDEKYLESRSDSQLRAKIITSVLSLSLDFWFMYFLKNIFTLLLALICICLELKDKADQSRLGYVIRRVILKNFLSFFYFLEDLIYLSSFKIPIVLTLLMAKTYLKKYLFYYDIFRGTYFSWFGSFLKLFNLDYESFLVSTNAFLSKPEESWILCWFDYFSSKLYKDLFLRSFFSLTNHEEISEAISGNFYLIWGPLSQAVYFIEILKNFNPIRYDKLDLKSFKEFRIQTDFGFWSSLRVLKFKANYKSFLGDFCIGNSIEGYLKEKFYFRANNLKPVNLVEFKYNSYQDRIFPFFCSLILSVLSFKILFFLGFYSWVFMNNLYAKGVLPSKEDFYPENFEEISFNFNNSFFNELKAISKLILTYNLPMILSMILFF